MKKLEILSELQKCDTETQSEQMPLEKHRVATNFQFVKNKVGSVKCNKMRYAYVIPVSLDPLLTLVIFHFKNIAILPGLKWYLMVVLTCIFQMTNDIEHIFMWLLAICTFSLGKCLFKFFAHLFRLTVFFLLSRHKFLKKYILDSRSLSDI